MYFRVESAIKPEFPDPVGNGWLRKIELALPEIRNRIRWARLLEVYWIHSEGPRESVLRATMDIFKDDVSNWLFTGNLLSSAAGGKGGTSDLLDGAPHRWGGFLGIEKKFRAGVTDNAASTATEAFQIVLGNQLEKIHVSSGSLLILEGEALTETDLSQVAKQVFCNELIETWSLLDAGELKKSDRFHPDEVKWHLPTAPQASVSPYEIEKIDLSKKKDAELIALSEKRLWALNLDEMKTIRNHFSDPKTLEKRTAAGMGPLTDVEMEVLAQTWSEHCKHKIFRAEIEYSSSAKSSTIPAHTAAIPKRIGSLFKETVSGATEACPKPWLISVFTDNAGVIDFDTEDAIAIKVETHNSPSALDPYGGALTGILGVNRDILGCAMGARPIFNTDVFCLARPDTSQELPERLLHPLRILHGVRLGVEHGGNKSGIPTVNGALYFDQSYLGKPLIFCGTGGLLPKKVFGRKTEEKTVLAGDRICMVGGRIGKDGIHGATFSSLALDPHSPSTAVQLGDPITQKRVMDFLIEARDQGLYRTLTDNGAGGLSSSVGELALASGGAQMDVGLAKTKYPGLKPYELVISESQERMTVAVPGDKLKAFLELGSHRGVEVSDLGEFTASGYFHILYHGKTIAYLDLEFLHGGVPKLKLQAEWQGEPEPPGVRGGQFEKEAPEIFLELLSRPNIASKEWLIRQYDHEVQGTSVIKPLQTVGAGTIEENTGPNDGAVIKPKADSWSGVVVACGLNPKLSRIDPFLMAQSAVDEAIRNALCVGAEYGKPESVLALVDNFCWPDPVNDKAMAAALVRTCFGMRKAVIELGVPLVSGKDSMKNDYRGTLRGENVKISVLPTLLMTAVGKIGNVRKARSADFKKEGDHIYWIGHQSIGTIGTEFHQLFVDRLKDVGSGETQVILPGKQARISTPDWEVARRIYSWLGRGFGETVDVLRSLHDVSEGGILVAIAESMLARKLGAKISIPKGFDPWEFCFGEGYHGFIASVSAAQAQGLEDDLKLYEVPFHRVGVIAGSDLEVFWREGTSPEVSFRVAYPEISMAWKKEGYWE